MRVLLRWLIYSNLFVGLVLAAFTASTYALMPTLQTEWHLILSIFCGSVVLYNFHRLYKVDLIPEAHLRPRHRWVMKHSMSIKALMLIALVAVVSVLNRFEVFTLVWIVPAALISAAYTIPMVPSKLGEWQRLRDIPLLKPLWIAITVCYLTTVIPAVNQNQEGLLLDFEFSLLTLQRFLLLLAMTIPFEIRDMNNDKHQGLQTLATVYGLRFSTNFSLIALGAFVLLSGLEYLLAQNWMTLAVNIFIAVLGSIFLRSLARISSEFGYVLRFEGLLLLYGLLHTSTHFWE